MLLKVKFWRIKNVLCAQVLHQDASLMKKGYYDFDADYGIESVSMPAIEENGYALFIRGSRADKDEHVASYVYETETGAICALEHFSKIIEKINASESNDPAATAEVLEYIVS